MTYYDWQGVPCSEQEFIAHMREVGLTEIHTQPVERRDALGRVSYQSKTFTIHEDHLKES